MLAASKLGSNVPPDHLQTAPVLTLTRIAPDEFKINLTASVLNTDPAKLSEQYATGQQAGLHPLIVIIQNREVSARIDPNRTTSVETELQPTQFKPSECTPGQTPQSPPYGINIKGQQENDPSGDEQATRGQNNDLQPGVRCVAG
jgi:hypothetical protein